MQCSLDAWINNGIPTFYYLDWENKICTWQNEKPSEYNYIKQFKWNKRICTLIGNFPKESIITYESKYRNIPFLKSHLQKCVRKGNVDLAIKTTKEFIFAGLTDFLRRLPIIVVEDVCLIEEYPTIIWFMLCNTQSILHKQSIVEWFLGFVKHLTICKQSKIYKKTISECNIEHAKNKTLFWSIQLRKKWGGMKCDIQLLEGVIHKHIKEDPVISLNIEPVFHEMEDLKLYQWDLTAIDFHCSNIIQELQKKYTISNSTLRRVIWNTRSRINFRKTFYMKDEDKMILDKLKTIDNIAKHILITNY